MTFPIEAVRSRYPALAEGYAHFDAAAGSLVAQSVAHAAFDVYSSAVANRTDGFEPGRRAIRIVDEARAAVADLLGARPDGIVFGQSATALTYLVSRTLAAGWRPGDEVVVTTLDHDANVRPWVQAAAAVGAVIRWAQVDIASGDLPVSAFEEVLSDRTKLVAFTAGSNANGTIPEVATIARLAHERGALCYVDGVHATPHLPVDLGALGADFYVTSAYKWSGPHLAACAADPRLWASLRPHKLMPSPDEVPDRFEHGTLSFASLAAIIAAVEHLSSLDASTGESRRQRLLRSQASVREYESALFERLLAGLAGIHQVLPVPAAATRCPTVSFRVDGQAPAQTARMLGDQGICVYSGDYYAYEFFTRLNLRDSGGAVRAGIYHYNTSGDVDRLLDALSKIVNEPV